MRLSLIFTKKWRSASVYKLFLRLSSIYNFLRSSSNYNFFKCLKNVKVIFDLKKVKVVFHFQVEVRSSSILRLPVVILTKYCYFDTPTDGRPGGA